MISILQLAKSFQFLQFSSTSYIRPRCILHAVATTKFLVAVQRSVITVMLSECLILMVYIKLYFLERLKTLTFRLKIEALTVRFVNTFDHE